MKTIGIDLDSRFLAYEGSTFWGYPIWPTPTLIAVNIVDELSETLKPGSNQGDLLRMDYVLVDEAYEPTSRIRKGRLFKRYEGAQPHPWHVQPHPAKPDEQTEVRSSGVLEKRLATYCEFSLSVHLEQVGIDKPLFLLGNEREFTVWSLVDVETTVSGEPLVYLKARQVFGALPRLNEGIIPVKDFHRIREKLDTLAKDLHYAVPESVVDRCREAVTAILSAYLQNEGHTVPGKDLGVLATTYETKVNPKNLVVAGQARTIARLHSRGKNAEQEVRGVRPPSEADAELAVQAVGIILRDLGWAE